MNNHLVSIIIPTYNRAHLIGETLDSVLAQSYQNWECIVVDDGSTDNTEEFINTYVHKDSRFQYHQRPKERPKGGNAARNYGFEVSKGEYVNWLDSDDLIHPNKLEIQITILELQKIDFVVCQSLVFENTIENPANSSFNNVMSETPFEDYVYEKIKFLTSIPIWRKLFLQENKFVFEETLEAAQEWEFHAKVLLKKPKYHRVEQVLVYTRKHIDSITYNEKNTNNKALHYLLARNKIFNLISKEENYQETKQYLSNYFIDAFKKQLLLGQHKEAKYIYINIILRNEIILKRYRLQLFIALFFFKIFRRGELLLKVKNVKNI